MNKAFDMILERIKKNSYTLILPDNSKELGTTLTIIEQVIKEVEQKYNNGWIPCHIEMPKEHDSIFARFKGTDKWREGMFEKISDTVNVTVADEKGNRTTTYAETMDGEWNCDLLRANKAYYIAAWCPLPEPYKDLEKQR